MSRSPLALRRKPLSSPSNDTAIAAYNTNHASTDAFTDLYDLLIDMISDWIIVGSEPVRHPVEGVDPSIYAWIIGARDVNADNGFFASFIRDYTLKQ